MEGKGWCAAAELEDGDMPHLEIHTEIDIIRIFLGDNYALFTKTNK